MISMKCREGCGACCIALSISSPIPGMPAGKRSGQVCVQLDEHFRCRIFGSAQRPACCGGLQPQATMCGDNRQSALQYLYWLESVTTPEGVSPSPITKEEP